MQPAQRVAVNTSFLYARMGITVFISLYATRLILGALGVEDFGIFNLVGGVIAMLTFLNNAMATATQRFMSYSQGDGRLDRQKQIFNVSVILHIVIAVLILLLLEGTGYFLFNGILKISEARMDAAKLIYQFMIISTLFTVISVPYDAVINAHENMLFVAILGIIEAVLKLAIAFFILKAPYDKLSAFGLLMAALSVFLLILRRIYCHRAYAECEFNIRRYYDKPLFKEMTSFAGWSFLGSSSSMLGYYGQGIVLNMFFGTVVNAAQGVAGQISGQLGAFAGTMLKALNPVIAKSEGAGDRTRMLKASMLGSKLSFFLLVIFYVPVIIEMPYIFHLWLKNVPDYAIIFCRLLLLRNLIEQLYITLASSIAAVGNIKNYQIYSSTLYVIPLIVSYFLFLLHYSPSVLYVVFLIFALINLLVTMYFARVICGLSIMGYLKTVVLRCILSFGLIFAISAIPFPLMHEGLIRLLFVVGISFVSFSFTIWFIGFTQDERRMASQMIRNFLRKIKITHKTFETN
ncbi:MAG: MATE family efflux transporter [Bacteroidota bacterium]|nr:MATE family efflux transporter [Bacteroidota bacterium]